MPANERAGQPARVRGVFWEPAVDGRPSNAQGSPPACEASSRGPTPERTSPSGISAGNLMAVWMPVHLTGGLTPWRGRWGGSGV